MIETSNVLSRGHARSSAVLGWAGILAVAAIAGVASIRFQFEAVVVATTLLVGVIVLTRSQVRDGAITFGWIPVAWTMLMFVSDHSFMNLAEGSRSPLDAASGKPSLENLVELATYALVAAMVIRSRRLLLGAGARWRVPKGPLLAFPALALLSVLWSPIALFTLTRASQLLIVVALALLMVRVWQISADLGESVWRSALGMFVQVTTVLSIIGLLFPAAVSGRYTWPGSGPGGAAVWVGASLLVLIVGGRSFAPFPRWAYWPRIVIFILMLNLTLTRSVILALPFAGLVVLWDIGRNKPIARYLGVWYYASAAFVTVALAEFPIFDYLSRGDSEESLTTLSGRIPLWEIAIDDLFSAGNIIQGYGYGAARIVLFPQVPWAGTAHSTWVEALVGIGIIGVVVLAGTIFFLVWRLAVAERSVATTRVALSLLAFLLVVSVASELIALPGSGFGLLALISVPALSKWKRFHEPEHRSLPFSTERTR